LRFPQHAVQRSFLSRPNLGTIWKAYLCLNLTNRSNPPASIGTWAQIDSGADYSIFPAQLADALELRIPDGTPSTFIGIGGTRHEATFHLVEIAILDVSTNNVWHKFEMEAGFSEALNHLGTGVLGIHGFFSRFQVTFLQKMIDIEPF
jgi:Aspartyl protease